MADHLIASPAGFRPVCANEPGKSPTRQGAAALVTLVQLVGAGMWKDPQAYVGEVYEEITGQPDVPANQQGVTKAQVLAWLTTHNIATIDMDPLLSDPVSLKHEIQAQNLSGVRQLLVLGREDILKHAVTGAVLHNWLINSPGQPASLIREGYSDSVAYAYYLDVALNASFAQPVPITWDDIQASGLLACIAILPAGVEAPPSDFRFFAGLDSTGSMLPPNPWPVPAPVPVAVDVESVSSTLTSMETAFTAADQALQAATQALQAAGAARESILASIGKAS
jgi:hypothetical protein